MRYIDLMGGRKPHLLVYDDEQHGRSRRRFDYTASTEFYLQDRREGHPWVTRLPFPVHVIERVENRDLVSNTKLVSTYRIVTAIYDGVEREFRGFAYVEQRDAESVAGGIRPAAGRHQDLVSTTAPFSRKAARGLFQGPGQSGIFLPATRRRPSCRTPDLPRGPNP